MICITGVEADYDGEAIDFDKAVEIAEKAGLSAIIYTSPSHTREKPRWRVLCPTSRELAPKQRTALLARLNGLYGGVFSTESWTLSQSYYFGRVGDNPDHGVEIIDGEPIDLLEDLDLIAIGKPNGSASPGARGNGAAGPLDEHGLANDIISGKTYHASSVRLVGKWAQQGMPLLHAQQKLYALFDRVFPPDRDEHWRTRRADVPRCVLDIYGAQASEKDEKEAALHEHLRAHGGEEAEPIKPNGKAAEAEALAPFNPAMLVDVPVPPRRWLVPDWVPRARATALYGAGGEGKTVLAQMLATACAIDGGRWLGLPVLRCKSLLVFCEDDLDEMHRRQEDINDALTCTFADLSDMRWLPRLGADNALMDFTGHPHHTPLFHKILSAAQADGARLVVLDTLADIFPGNENDRGQARAFTQQALGLLAREIDGAVVALAHPSRAGMNSGSGESGSTAWIGTFRSQLYLATPRAEGEAEPADPDLRMLTRRKSNAARANETIDLRWRNGVFVPTRTPGIIGSIERRTCERVFVDLLNKTNAEGQHVSHNSRAGNYAPKVFGLRPERDRERFKKADFERALQTLLSRREIGIESYRDEHRHYYQRLRAVACGHV